MSEKVKKLIDPKVYKKILEGLQLKSLSVMKGQFTSSKENFIPNSEVDISEKAQFEIESKNSIKILHNYNLKIKNHKNKKNILQINLSFELVFSSKETFTQEFFDVYKEDSLPINTWPYFREFVSSLIQRMNFPPLTLPLFKGKHLH